MRKVLKTLLALILLAAAGFAAVLGGRAFFASRAITFVSSVVSENSPIAELATRKIVWKVFHVENTMTKDTVRDTVYTVKIGYDLAQAEPPAIDRANRTVTLKLPPPKIISVDHLLQRTVAEKKSFVERVFGTNTDTGEADRQDVRQLAADCEKYGLLSAASIRESVTSLLAGRLEECGFKLILEDGLDVPAKILFNAYFEEKGVGFRL